MSIEDFGTDLVYGVRLAYHLTEGFFVEGTVGQTEAGLTSFESLSGGARLFEDRTLTYYNLNLGYNILPGEGFIGEKRAYNTQFYLIAGLGSTEFAEDDRFTVNFGAGLRLLLNDAWTLAVRLPRSPVRHRYPGRGEDGAQPRGYAGIHVFLLRQSHGQSINQCLE